MDRTFTRYSGSEIVDQGKFDVTWQQVRKERDQALADSDWRAGKDVVLSSSWKEYREALRTLPQRFDDAGDACDAWPVMPDA